MGNVISLKGREDNEERKETKYDFKTRGGFRNRGCGGRHSLKGGYVLIYRDKQMHQTTIFH